MTDEREKDSEAKDGDRLLAAYDQRPEDSPFQPGPVLRYKSRHHERSDDEMQRPIRGEIYLVVGIEGVEQPCRQHSCELRIAPRHRHHQRESEISNSQIEQGTRPEN